MGQNYKSNIQRTVSQVSQYRGVALIADVKCHQYNVMICCYLKDGLFCLQVEQLYSGIVLKVAYTLYEKPANKHNRLSDSTISVVVHRQSTPGRIETNFQGGRLRTPQTEPKNSYPISGQRPG